MVFSRRNLLLLALVCLGVNNLHVVNGEVVFWLEESNNTAPYIRALQTASAKFFEDYSGRGNKYSFTVYRMNYEGNLEKTLTESRDANELTGTFARVAANPLPYEIPCKKGCCEGTGLINYLPQIVSAHKGSTMFIILDTISYYDEQTMLNLSDQVRRAQITLFLVRAADSYCMNGGQKELYGIGLTNYHFVLNLADFENVLGALLQQQYSADLLGYASWGTCPNKIYSPTVRGNPQALTLYLYDTRLNRPLEVYDPNGVRWQSTLVTHFNDNVYAHSLFTVFGGKFSKIWTFLVEGCEQGWTFKDGHCYLRRPSLTTFQRADADCRARNATLLAPVTGRLPQALRDDDDLWIQDGDLELSSVAWISLLDNNNEREFRWNFLKNFINLANINLTNWAPGEPSTGVPLGKRCVRADRNGQWTTTTCLSLLPYTCTKPAYIFEDEGEKPRLPAGDWTIIADSFVGCVVFAFQLD